MTTIQQLAAEFVSRATAIIENEVRTKVRDQVLSALVRSGGLTVSKKPRRKGPIQLCPVPGCKHRAAPVFGMVCADHKSVAKTRIKKYREARRARKA